jgi:hypothetical protein
MAVYFETREVVMKSYKTTVEDIKYILTQKLGIDEAELPKIGTEELVEFFVDRDGMLLLTEDHTELVDAETVAFEEE